MSAVHGTEREENMEEVIVYTDCLNLDCDGDFVRCSNCGALMLIQLGGTTCKECESKNLQWVDETKPEWNYEEIEEAGYIVVEK